MEMSYGLRTNGLKTTDETSPGVCGEDVKHRLVFCYRGGTIKTVHHGLRGSIHPSQLPPVDHKRQQQICCGMLVHLHTE